MTAATLTRTTFTTAHADLELAAKILAVVVPKRAAVPILEHVLVQVNGPTVTFSAFDYENSARLDLSTLGGDVYTSFVVPFHKITAALKMGAVGSTPAKRRAMNVTIDPEERTFTFANGTVAKWETDRTPEDYPEIPATGSTVATVAAPDLTRILQVAESTRSRDETLPLLVGTQLVICGGVINAMSTDRYRLSHAYAHGDTDPTGEVKILARSKPMLDMVKLIPDHWVNIGFSDDGGTSRRVSFTHPGTDSPGIGVAFTATLIEGDYPPVMRLFPEKTSLSLTIDRAQVLNYLKGLTIPRRSATPVIMNVHHDRVEFSYDDTGTWAVPCEANDEWKTAFNPGLLKDTLNALTGDTATIAQEHENKPALFTGADNTRVLLMPVRFGIH